MTEHYKCLSCSATAGCNTCVDEPSKCLSCLSGFTLNGWKCERNYALKFNITVNSTLSSFGTRYYKDFILYFLGIVNTGPAARLLQTTPKDANSVTVYEIVAVTSNTTRITFSMGLSFAVSQSRVLSEAKKVFDAVYGSNSVILTNLTINSMVMSVNGDSSTTITSNYCPSGSTVTGCSICDFMATTCKVCQSGYTYNTDSSGKGFCVECNVGGLCKGCKVKNVCNECLDGYTFVGSGNGTSTNQCLQCNASNCLQCLFVSNKCSKCADGYYLDANTSTCIKCPLSNC